MRCLVVILVAAKAAVARAEPPPPPTAAPSLDPRYAVTCFVDKENMPWRGQCTPGEGGRPGRCVVAIDGETDARGRVVRPLERVRRCNADVGFDLADREREGYAIVRGVADAPRGWRRDGRGRVYQITFDLHRRSYAGIGWAPIVRRAAGGEGSVGRTAFEVGLLELGFDTGDSRAGLRHRLHLVQGTIALAPFAVDGALARYDLSRKRRDPLVRLTTFVGEPRRYDLDAQLGGWFELVRTRIDDVASGRRETLVQPVAAQLTWDLWRSARMDSFVRLRGGGALEHAALEGEAWRASLTPAGALEGDVTLDDSGYNRIDLLAQLERPYRLGEDEPPAATGRAPRRVLTRVGYERILLAINDQPVSLRLAAEAEYRSDVPDVAPGWELRALAGLRFSLWAPAR